MEKEPIMAECPECHDGFEITQEESRTARIVCPSCGHVMQEGKEKEKEIKIDNSNLVCTKDKKLVVGGIYDYKEGMPRFVARVEVLSDDSDDKYLNIPLKILKSPTNPEQEGTTFTVSFAKGVGNIYYEGMGRFWDKGSYVREE